MIEVETWQPVHSRFVLAPPEGDLSELLATLPTITTLSIEIGSVQLIVGRQGDAWTASRFEGDGQFFDLVGDAHSTGTQNLVVGGQEVDFPSRLVIDQHQALATLRRFLDGAPAEGDWELQ